MATLLRKAFCCLFIVAGVGVFLVMMRLGLNELGNAITACMFAPPLVLAGIVLLLNEPNADAAAEQIRRKTMQR